MRELVDHQDLVALCDSDTLCLWAAQGLDGRSRAFTDRDGRAVAVAGPGLSVRDRLAVHGEPVAAVTLVGEVLAEVGPSYRLLGEPALIDALVAGVPELAAVKAFGWMDTTTLPPPSTAGRAAWLTDAELPEATALLEAGFPASYAKPGTPGVQGWAGVRDAAGRLLAVAALAWSAPEVGLIAGVAVGPKARGQGLGHAVCTYVLAAAVHRHGAAALMIDEWNHPARRLYERLGMRHRPLCAAAAVVVPL
ncbi:MAG: GNAT family N-acetyltransferase [Sciscionella sp.]